MGAVPVQHLAIIHLVDVIAGQDEGKVGSLGFDALEILEHGVGRPLVPVLMHPLHGRNHLDVLAQLGGEDSPAVADVADQFEGFILC